MADCVVLCDVPKPASKAAGQPGTIHPKMAAYKPVKYTHSQLCAARIIVVPKPLNTNPWPIQCSSAGRYQVPDIDTADTRSRECGIEYWNQYRSILPSM